MIQDIAPLETISPANQLRLPRSLGWWLVAIYVVLFLIRPWEELFPSLQAIRFERLYAILMIAGALLTGRRLKWSWQSATVALFTLATVLSSFRAWQSSYAWPSLYQYATVVVTYFLMLIVCRQFNDLNALIVTLVGAMYLYLGKSLWEYVVHDRHQFAQGVNRLVGIESTYGEPNAVAMSAVLSLPAWWYLWRCRAELSGAWTGLRQSLFRSFLWTYPAIVLVSVGLTNSRAGMLGLAGFLVGAIWYGPGANRPWRAIGLATILLVGLLLVALREQRDRLRTLWNPNAGPSNAQASAAGRWEGFLAALQMLRDRPLTGVGLGNFLPYRVAYIDGVGLVAHNLPGQILGETGWLGGFTFVLMAGCTWRNARRIQRLSAAYEGLGVFQEFARSAQLTILLLLLFGLSLHNGLRYNWLWVAAFTLLAWQSCQAAVSTADVAEEIERVA